MRRSRRALSAPGGMPLARVAAVECAALLARARGLCRAAWRVSESANAEWGRRTRARDRARRCSRSQSRTRSTRGRAASARRCPSVPARPHSGAERDVARTLAGTWRLSLHSTRTDPDSEQHSQRRTPAPTHPSPARSGPGTRHPPSRCVPLSLHHGCDAPLSASARRRAAGLTVEHPCRPGRQPGRHLVLGDGPQGAWP